MLAEVFLALALICTPAIEPIWQRLCESIPEYRMFVWGCFASQILTYFLGCLPYIILDFTRNRRSRRYKVQPTKYAPRSAVVFTAREILVSFSTVVLPMLLGGGFFIHLIGITRDGPIPSRFVVAVQIAYFFLVEDFVNYWFHRWLHLPWLYRHIHSVHHTYTAPFSVAAAYAHPAEVVILAVPTFLGPLLVGPHLYTLMIWQVMRNYEAIDIHSGYELPVGFKQLIPGYAGTAHHDYHHYMHSGNFASVFTWCDRLYGTHLGYESYVEKRKA